MDFEQARFNMIEQQIRPWEVLDSEVLDTLALIKRELFVPPKYAELALADLEIPLGGPGQIMLAPKIEGHFLQVLGLKKSDKVLEIGTGSGYMAALLATRAGHVHSVDIDPAMTEMARANLARAGITNVKLETGDAARGWAAHAPYNAIVVSGALPYLPDSLLMQLAPEGRLVAIVGEPPVMTAQLLTHSGEGRCNVVGLFETLAPTMKNAARREAFVF
ncbi:MAG: protein-L-isoaspartate O-methyltransferase [Betaproteobacteria bacterium]|nr:protein-L-isoaspartate O-methyltransferase [Betaproteobacteria bacterium]